MKSVMSCAVCLSLLVAASSGAVWADDEASFSMGAGLDYSTGNYGTANTTNISATSVYATYANDAWLMKLTVPYLRVSGDDSVIASGGGMGSSRGGTGMGGTGMGGGGTTNSTTQSGIGDVAALATYNAVSSADGETGIDLTGRIKFGTASSTLGSGMNDYAVELTAYSRMGEFSPSLTAGYEFLGSSAELPLNNVAYTTLGGGYAFNDQTQAGIEYHYAQRASATGHVKREVNLNASTQIGEDVYLRAYMLQGLSDGSPDKGFGLSVSAGF